MVRTLGTRDPEGLSALGRNRRLPVGLGALALLWGLAGCGSADQRSVPEPTGPSVPTHSVTPSPSRGSATPAAPTASQAPPAAPATIRFPCDPGGGFPRARKGCPDPRPETGWLRQQSGGRLTLEPFTTYGNDAAGRAYAQAHGVEFPFSNDYHDAPAGAPYVVRLDPRTVCTGIIAVGYRAPLADHVVPCSDLAAVATRQRVPVAVWREGTGVVQVSELYRP